MKVFKMFLLLALPVSLRLAGQDVASGLIGHWKFDEPSGTTATDSSGNNYHAQLFNAGTGAASWVDGKVNGGIQLDGTNDYLAIQTLNYTQAGQIPAVTVVAWVKSSKNGLGNVISFDNSEYWRFGIGYNTSGAGGNKIFFGTTDSNGDWSNWNTSSVGVCDGQWHQIAASYSAASSTKKIYVDGSPDSTFQVHSGKSLGSGVSRFGVMGKNGEDSLFNQYSSSTPAERFQGTLDEIRLYDRALTDADVAYLYSQATTDTDSDGLTNAEEDSLGTNSNNADSDGDGVDDLSEINQGRNPNFAELTGWTEVGDAVWARQSSDLTVFQSFNSTSHAFYLSPYDLLNKKITFEMKVSDPTDNDYIGFVVGYVDASNYHYFTWTRSEPSGAAGPPDGWKFQRVENGVTTVLAIDETDYTRGWEQDAQYKVTVHYTSGKTVIHLQGGTLAYANGQTLVSASGNFASGKFAFYCNSQPSITYENLKFEPLYSPTLSLIGNSSMSVEGATSFSDPGATASDPEDGNLTSSVQVSGTVDLQTVGPYVLTYTVTDSSGIEVNATRTVNVVDTTAPVITLNGSATVTHEASTPYLDAGAGWTDTVYGQGSLNGAGAVNVAAVGSYQLTFDYTDAAGNAAARVIRTVNVVDTTVPVITLNGSATVTHEASTPYLDSGAGWTDTLDGQGSLNGAGTVNVAAVGSYQLTFDYTDAAGNAAARVIRTVNVVDTTVPVISLTGDQEVRHQVWQAYLDDGATGIDSVDGNLTSSILLVNPVDLNQPGRYVLTYDLTDASGNAAQQISRTVEVYNSAPNDILLSGAILDENQPAGTWAGEFSTNDPDDPGGVKDYLYTLVEGNGSTDNANFVLELNGTLRSATTFDFESRNAFQIRVRSTDEFGGYKEEAFQVKVTDCFVPVVETLSAREVQASSAKLSGRLEDAGGLSILERGFVLGAEPFPVHGQAGVSVIAGQLSGNSGEFDGQANNLTSMGKYYLRAFARNSEGIGYGLEKSFDTSGWLSKPAWTDSTPGGAQDWWTSPWFGNFFLSANGWAMHDKMGWVYPVKGKTAGVWFWKKGQGWLWTDSDLYPRLYADSYKSWVYFYGAWEGKKLFFRYDEDQWITSEEK